MRSAASETGRPRGSKARERPRGRKRQPLAIDTLAESGRRPRGSHAMWRSWPAVALTIAAAVGTAQDRSLSEAEVERDETAEWRFIYGNRHGRLRDGALSIPVRGGTCEVSPEVVTPATYGAVIATRTVSCLGAVTAPATCTRSPDGRYLSTRSPEIGFLNVPSVHRVRFAVYCAPRWYPIPDR